MAFHVGSLDETIAAAAGDDPELFAELKRAFADSIARQIDLLRRSRCDGNWEVAARRLKGVAASFHAEALISLADEALEGAPGDPVVLRRLQQFLDRFAGG